MNREYSTDLDTIVDDILAGHKSYNSYGDFYNDANELVYRIGEGTGASFYWIAQKFGSTPMDKLTAPEYDNCNHTQKLRLHVQHALKYRCKYLLRYNSIGTPQYPQSFFA